MTEIETLNAAARQVGDLTAIITGGKLSSDQIPAVRAQAHALAVAISCTASRSISAWPDRT